MRPQTLFVTFITLFALLLAASSPAAADPGGPRSPAAALGASFTYQGQLQTGNTLVSGSCDFQFSLYDDALAGAQVGATQSVLAVAVAGGRFTVALNDFSQFGAGAFTGSARWLTIAVRCPAGSGSYIPLSPRQPLTAAPYALALPGLYTVANGGTPNVVGGYENNTVGATVSGATIGGGGAPGNANKILDNYATVAGGFANWAGNGTGANNDAAFATVGGGAGNTATADSATVAGGNTNHATGQEATVAGGGHNTASGYAAMVPGGEFNVALGDYSFAAGRTAYADHTGAFVWADQSGGALHSTANNQFLVRAAGGVGINTASPGAALDVAGNASGALRVSTGAAQGSVFSAIQAGTAGLGLGISGVNVFTVTFPSTFSAIPSVVVTARSVANASDTFVASTRQVTTGYFVVNVVRVDPPNGGTGWGQSLQLDWFAWQ